MENTVVIGDYYNDIDLMRAAGHAVAVGQRPPEVKLAADEVVASCTSGGWGISVFADQALYIKQWEVIMETQTIKQLQKTANLVRQGVIEGTFCAKSGHPGIAVDCGYACLSIRGTDAL